MFVKSKKWTVYLIFVFSYLFKTLFTITKCTSSQKLTLTWENPCVTFTQRPRMLRARNRVAMPSRIKMKE